MSLKKNIFFCLNCNASAFSKEKIIHEDCDVPSYIIQAEVIFTMNRTRWRRFLDWFFSHDLSLGLAILGIVVVNTVLVTHLHLSVKECLIEGLGLGFAIPRLLK